VSSADLSGLSEPRTRPDISTAAYYLVLLVYASQYIVELAAGPEAADALRLNLANDHAAVAAGDVLRLFTSAFASDTPRQLGVTLLCIFTVGSELESLVGSGVYWAVLCLSAVAGGLADAAFSPRPLTGGPGPIVAGLVAALLAYHVKNWAVEARVRVFLF
jgi:membrane associated rhomboid family serine protease